MTYHRYKDIYEKSSYSPIMINLTDAFNGSLYSRIRTINEKSYSSFIMITFTSKTNALVIDYLDKYPL